MKEGLDRYLLVNAKSGFGKTTYMKRYIRENNVDALWIELTPMCNESMYFLKVLIQQIKKRIYDVDSKSLYGYDTDFSYYPYNGIISKKGEQGHGYIQELFRLLERFERAEGIKKCIVLDNIQIIKSQGVTELLESMMKFTDSVKWYFIGRQRPDFLVKYCIREECRIIGEKQLSLKADDVINKVKKELSMQKTAAKKLANVFMEYFHGWAAGIGELIRYVKDNEEVLSSSKVNWEAVILGSNIPQYIEREICSEIPYEELKFLKMFTVLPPEDEELGRLLLQESGLGLREEELEKKYFFIQCQNNCLTVWPGFAIVLRQMQSKGEIRRIKQIVAKYYISRGEYQKANVYMLKSGDFELIQEYLILYRRQLCSDERIGLAINCILFLLESSKPLLSEVLQIMGKSYEGNDVKEQKRFFLALLNYNEDPLQMRNILLPYFYKVYKESMVGTKLEISIFGKFKVQIGENQKEVSWRTKKGCELFAYLIKMEGTPISRQELMNILWEYEIPKNAVSMLHNMIYNIRKELAPYGLEEVIKYKDKMYSLEMGWIGSELKVWESIAENAEELDYLLEHEDWVENYPGEYMENIDSQWVLEQRYYFDNKYIEVCMKLADYYMKQEDYRKAKNFLKNVLMLDNLREEALEKLLYCHGKLGERKQVQHEYSKFSNIIKKELNVEPCKKVQMMYDVVMSME